MNMSVIHNMAAMNGNRMLGITTDKKAKSTEKLSSGYRVNRAADDAAGLAISEKMRRQIKGLTQASANAQDGISMVQIADGALNEIHDMLHRVNQLAIEAANDTLSTEDREYIQMEIDNLADEIDGISDRTTFNEVLVLKGGGHWETKTETITPKSYSYSIDAASKLPPGVTIDADSANNGYMSQNYNGHVSSTIDFSGLPTGTDGKVDLSALDGKGFYTTCCTCSNHYSITFDSSTSTNKVSGNSHYTYTVGTQGCETAADVVNRIISATGGQPNNHYTMFEAQGNTLRLYDYRTTVTADANHGTVGSGVAKEVEVDGTPYDVTTTELVDKGDLYLQVGVEAGQGMNIRLPDIDSKKVGISDVSVMTQLQAGRAIEKVKSGLAYVSEERSRMGAYQNRLEHTIRNLDNVVENTTAADSRLRDTDMAEEMVNFSNLNILEQAGSSVLAQANQRNQNILSLLQ